MTEHTFSPKDGEVLAVLADIDERLTHLAAHFDPCSITPEAAASVVAAAARIEKLIGAVGALAAGRAAQGDTWRTDGAPDPAAWLAALTGCSKARALGTIDSAGRLGEQPATDTALRRGQLSVDQLRVISPVVADAPGTETDLLAVARHEPLGRLRRHADAARAAALGDDDTRQRRAHRDRSATAGVNTLGEFVLSFTGAADKGTVLLQALRVFREEQFRLARDEGRTERLDALTADALIAMAQVALGQRPAPTVGGAATKVIVRVDYTALVRGHLGDGEVCEIAGLGPIPVPAAQAIMARPDTLLGAVLTKGKRVAGVAHLRRGPDAHQRTALEWLHPTCVAQSCDNTILEWDHNLDWQYQQTTTLENLDGLCGPCHNRKTNDGWRLETGTGRRRLLPPDHPHHPHHPGHPHPTTTDPRAADTHQAA